MAGFTKLYSEIITSSIWSETHATRVVWVTMLAMADSSGRVDASIPGLARTANVSLDECERAITTFGQPDPYSRSQEYEGRRIAAVDGGWLLLNYEKYRGMRDPEERQRQNREAKRRQREREKDVSHGQQMSATISPSCQPSSAHTEAEADSSPEACAHIENSQSKRKRARIFVKPRAEQVREYAQSIGFPLDGQTFVDFYESKGWLVGKNPMKDWRAAVRTWKQRGASSNQQPADDSPADIQARLYRKGLLRPEDDSANVGKEKERKP